MELILKESLPPQKAESSKVFSRVMLLITFIGLYFTSSYNYLLFHSLVELFSIVVAFTLFVIVWNSKHFIRNQYLLFIGIAYLFVGFIDLLHTLSYKGMSIFKDYDYYANQLWIGARYLESLSLLLAFGCFYTEKPLRPYRLLLTYALVTTVLISTIFVWKIFPECFIENTGLTAFKKNSEYIICAILVVNMFLLFKNKERFEKTIFILLLWTLICTIISELAFTFYISNYGFSNLVGHYFKLFSFIFVYLAIIKICIEEPYKLIFRELDKTNKQLGDEIETRKKTEAELGNALAEVKQLSGLLPICASCKNIRDDKGYWRQIESFIRDHSDAEFSHGICPDCVRKLYPDLAEDILKKSSTTEEIEHCRVVATRKKFKRFFEKEWSRCARESKPLSLIIANFPGVTKCEEKIIHEVEKILSSTLRRPYDHLDCYEDDLYAIILPNTDDRGVRQVADTILHDYVKFRSEYIGGAISSVNIHVAMATTFPQQEGEPKSFISVVEKNLGELQGQKNDHVSQIST